MVTDRYQHVRHHGDVASLAAWAADNRLPLVGVDNLPGSVVITEAAIPRECVFLFGQEGPGLSAAARQTCEVVLHIPQYGSTRSINAGVASGVAMYEWVRRYGSPPDDPHHPAWQMPDLPGKST
jgi:tRNA G18 (ribose-2'-O)-methylase SpoU